MISLTINNTADFMNKLLVNETFDNLLLSEATFQTACSYTIDGRINPSFYNSVELQEIGNRIYMTWKSQRPHAFNLIKGSKVPTSLKIIFALSETATAKLIKDNNIDLALEDIDGLFININYKDDAVTIITGTSLKVFTLDKTLEKAFDNYLLNTFDACKISYTQN